MLLSQILRCQFQARMLRAVWCPLRVWAWSWNHTPRSGHGSSDTRTLTVLKVFTQWLVLLSLCSSMTRSCHPEKRNKLGKKSTEFIENIPQPRKWCSVEGSCGIGQESSDFDHAFLDLKPLCLYGSESCLCLSGMRQSGFMPQTDGSLLSFCHLFSANLTRETSSASRTVELSQCCCTWSMSERCWLLSFAAWGTDWANAWKMML